MEGAGSDPRRLDEEKAWSLLLRLAARARAGDPFVGVTAFRVGDDGVVVEVANGDGAVTIHAEGDTAVEAALELAPAVREMLELYLPLVVGPRSRELVVGHLGQSLDGQIATASGASAYVTGPANIRHLHRLRALFDAVLVGAQTVAHDNPQLTTRLVTGSSPTRVVLDPTLRLGDDRRVFQDRAAKTLVFYREAQAEPRALGDAEVVAAPGQGTAFDLEALVAALRRRGLRRLFVEGGGITVSRFLASGALDRLHVTVGSVFLGVGRPGVVLPGIDEIRGALRPRTRRFLMGDDVLFDCAFER